MKTTFFTCLLICSLSLAETSPGSPFPYFQCRVNYGTMKDPVLLREREGNGPLRINIGNHYYFSFRVYEYQLYVGYHDAKTEKELLHTEMFAGEIPFDPFGEVYGTNLVIYPEVFPNLSSEVYLRCKGLDIRP